MEGKHPEHVTKLKTLNYVSAIVAATVIIIIRLSLLLLECAWKITSSCRNMGSIWLSCPPLSL